MDQDSAHMVAASKEVIKNGNTAPKTTVVEGVKKVIPLTTAEEKAQKRLEVKARSTLMMGIPNEHQLKFNSIKDAKLLMEAVENRFGKNAATKKTQRNLLKQHYENITTPSSEMLDQTFDRLQKLVSQFELLGETISQEDVNQKLLRSLSSEWNTHAVVWRNKAELEIMSIDDLYNNLKVYEPEVKGMSSSSSINTANSSNVDNLSDDVIYAFLASQPNNPQLVTDDLQQIHPDDIEEMNLRWQMAMLTMRARRFLKNTRRRLIVNSNENIGFDKNQDYKNKESTKRNIPVETSTSTALVSCDGLGGYDWSDQVEEGPNYAVMAYSSSSSNSDVSNNSNCLKSCLKTIETLKSQYDQLHKDFKKSELMVLAYKIGLESVEEKLKVYKANESIYSQDIKVLKFEIECKDICKKREPEKLEIAQKEKDSIQFNVDKFENASKSLDKLIECQIVGNCKKGLRYNAVPPPYTGNIMPLTPDLSFIGLDEFVNKHVVENRKYDEEVSKVIRKSDDSPIIEDWLSDSEEEDVSQTKTEKKIGKNVNTARPKAVVNAVKGNNVNAVKASACWVWKPKTKVLNHVSKHKQATINGIFNKIKETLIVNAQGGKITGKSTIKTGNLDFENVYFVRELKFNLFSVSQMCDKKNSVLFNDTECIVLSPNFKLIDESQVLLRVPRKNNMYSVDLKNIVPKGGLTCLFAKATSDESKLWHRRLGHLNFKTMNKLVKGNLVRGLPSKLFENDQTCVACQKGKQHRASCKSKTENSISLPLHLLHMDLFGPTFVKSLMKKMYCLVVTDDYSRFTWVFFLATKDETSGILKTLIEAARTMLADSKLSTTFWAEAVNTACYVQNRVLVVKPHNKTPYELFHGRTPTLSFMRPFGCLVTILNAIDHLGKFDGKADEGFFVGYSLNSKAFRVFNSKTRIVEENLHIRFSENTPNVIDSGPDWLFDIDALTRTMNYKPIVVGTQSNCFAGTKASDNAVQARKETEPIKNYILLPLWPADPPFSQDPKSSHDDWIQTFNIELLDDQNMPALEDINIFDLSRDNEDVGAEADINNLDTTIQVSPIPTIRIHKDHPLNQEELLQFKLQEVWTLVDLPNGKRAIGTKWVFRNKKDERGIVIRNKARLVAQRYTQEEGIDYDEVFAPVARIEAIRIFLAYASFKDFVVYQMDVKSVFLYANIEEKMSSMGELTFFLGLQVQQKKDGIFISQDKYVEEILKKFRFTEVKTASTPIETQKPFPKDENGEEVAVYMYRSMIGSLMYLTSSRPDIMFAVYACARYQVNPKVSHLYAVKRIFRYLKGQPKLGLWYPKDSPFDLVAYTDSDYAGASSTT
ncbi:putative ribonuclease H-like domain-containing protein [Tanacetum coccineum]